MIISIGKITKAIHEHAHTPLSFITPTFHHSLVKSETKKTTIPTIID